MMGSDLRVYSKGSDEVGDGTSSLVGEHNEWDAARLEINVELTADNRPLPAAKHQRAAVP